jgi:hypothetical protein
MFPYDPAIAAAVQAKPQTISDVLRIMQTIDGTCEDSDGLKWFNWLYLAVTQAIEAKVTGGGFHDPAGLPNWTCSSRGSTSTLLPAH